MTINKKVSIFCMVSVLLLSQVGLVCSEEVEIGSIEDAVNAYFANIPLKKSSSTDLRYIAAKVNDAEIVMLIDSGATHTCFDVKTAKKAGVKLKQNTAGARGATGKTTLFESKVESVNIGGIIKLPPSTRYFIDLGKGKNIDIDGSNLNGGLLGFDILTIADFNLDLSANRILLPKQNIDGGYWSLLQQMGYQKINLSATSKNIYMPVKIGETEGYFMIDTGCSQMVIFERFIKGKNYSMKKKDSEVMAVGNKKIESKFAKIDDFQIPGYKITASMLIAPRESINKIEGKPVMGILGMPIIDQLKMVLNFNRKEAYLPKK